MGRVEQGRQRLLEIVTKLRAWEYIVVQGDAFAILFSAYQGSRKASFFDEIVQKKTNKKTQKSRYVSRFLQCSDYSLGNNIRAKIHLVVHVFEGDLHVPLRGESVGKYRS